MTVLMTIITAITTGALVGFMIGSVNSFFNGPANPLNAGYVIGDVLTLVTVLCWYVLLDRV